MSAIFRSGPVRLPSGGSFSPYVWFLRLVGLSNMRSEMFASENEVEQVKRAFAEMSPHDLKPSDVNVGTLLASNSAC